MRSIRAWLVLVALIACVATPAVAEAHRYKTKLTFSPLATTYYAFDDSRAVPDLQMMRPWTLETTSQPVPTLKGRLRYYRTATKKWLPLPDRSIYVVDATGYRRKIARTDAKGYFRYKVASPGLHRFRFLGSTHTAAAAKTIERTDLANTLARTSVTTSSVDSTRTRVSVAIDYQYNRWVDLLSSPGDPGSHGVYVYSSVLTGLDWRLLYSNRSFNPGDMATGGGRVEWSCVVPNASMEDGEFWIESSVVYRNGSIHGMASP